VKFFGFSEKVCIFANDTNNIKHICSIMKQILISITMALAALNVNAQGIIEFNEFTQGNNPCKWEAEGISLAAVDDKQKMSADNGKRKFEDGQRFESRLKTGGKSDRKSSLTLTADNAGEITIYASSGSSQEGRTVTVLQNGKTIASEIVDNQNKHPIKVNVEAGKVNIMYYDGAINFYGIGYKPVQ